jgi:DNA-binding beta-propeller fold protein YncE
MTKRASFFRSATLLCSLLLAGWPVAVSAQTKAEAAASTAKESYRIEWVKTWPTGNKNEKSRKFTDVLNGILLGKQTPELQNPVSVLAQDTGLIWILDQGSRTIFRVREGVGEIPHPLRKTTADLTSLVSVCEGPGNEVLFTDSHARKIYVLRPDSRKLVVLNDSLQLEQPTGIAWWPERKEIWVTETTAHRISVLNEKGELLRRTGSRGNAPAEFNYPTHLSIRNGQVYVTDAMNFRVQVLDADGKAVSVFGEAGDASGYMARPKGIAADSHGNIYVVDALFHTVQVFSPDGQLLTAFGTQGHEKAEFWLPSGIYIDKSDYIYIADTYNSRIQIFRLKTTVTQ